MDRCPRRLRPDWRPILNALDAGTQALDEIRSAGQPLEPPLCARERRLKPRHCRVRRRHPRRRRTAVDHGERFAGPARGVALHGSGEDDADGVAQLLSECELLRAQAGARGVELDDTAASLEALDQMPPRWRDDPEVLPWLGNDAGLYLGTVIVRTVPGASWHVWPGGHPVVRLASGREVSIPDPAPDQILALWRKCPHLGCMVPPLCAERHRFQCRCHGSTYNILGEKLEKGPAERGMDRFPVVVEHGVLVLDTSQVIRGGPEGTVTFQDPHPPAEGCAAEESI